MSANFQHTTRLAFRNSLYDRLGDTSKSFWIDSELNGIINETLYTFGAIAHSWKKKIELRIDNTKQFWDITTDAIDPDNLVTFNLTIQTILDQINFHLIENISALNPTSQITNLNEILEFIRNRINQYQFLTSLVLTKNIYPFQAPPINEVDVPDEVIDLVRVGFIDSANSNKTFKLRKEDKSGLSYNFLEAFSTTSPIPKFYTTISGDLNQIKVYPPPTNLGTLEVVSVNGIASNVVLNLATKIGIPDNLVFYLKWGVLFDIFSKDGIGQDLNRANYCLERWNEGIEVGRNYSSILFTTLNERPIQIDSLDYIDNMDSGWQNKIGKSTLIGLLGYNLLVVNRIPAVNIIYSIMFNSIINAYTPVDDNDFIDIKQEYIEPALDYGVHLASIKSGIAAIKQTEGLKNNFLKTAINHNQRLIQRGFSFENLMKKSKLQEIDEPRETEEIAA